MRIIVTGGAASGKSAHAERILFEHTPRGKRLYVATMQPFGDAAKARIARHHALRAGKGFETIEQYIDLRALDTQGSYEGILVECMSNLLANEMFSPKGAGDHAVQAILDGLDALEAQCRVLVVVTNEIFSDGESYPAETMCYMKRLAQLNTELICGADAAAESVCGILIPWKGTEFL